MTTEHGHDVIHIVVNGKAKQVTDPALTFATVIALAYPTPPSGGEILYIVAYHNADEDPKDGSLQPGQTIHVRNGTRFDVKHSVRS